MLLSLKGKSFLVYQSLTLKHVVMGGFGGFFGFVLFFFFSLCEGFINATRQC